jgi:3-keto-5-aminohexanoate cleavage enzyme
MKANGVRPELEIFDLSHLHGAVRLVEQGLVDERPHVQFVLGVRNAMPAEAHLLDLLLGELRRVLPQATWTAAGIGRHQAEVMGWALARGADAVRTGLEDNIRLTKDRLAGSNAELVAAAAAMIRENGRAVATPEQARTALRLPQGGADRGGPTTGS